MQSDNFLIILSIKSIPSFPNKYYMFRDNDNDNDNDNVFILHNHI